MKLSLMLLTLGLSFSALACPNLRGTYNSCSVVSGDQGDGPTLRSMTMSQSDNSAGGTVYTMVSTDDEGTQTESVTADGRPDITTEVVDGAVETTTLVTSCQNNVLKTDITVSVSVPDVGDFSFSGKSEIKKADGALVLSMKAEDASFTIVCR